MYFNMYLDPMRFYFYYHMASGNNNASNLMFTFNLFLPQYLNTLRYSEPHIIWI